MRVLWIAPPTTNADGEHVPGTAARDETAFRHALKAGHRLRQAGQRLKDAPIIDAYEHAYKVAQAHGGAGRPEDMPPMRDRTTMARRVRGYVTTSTNPVYQAHGTAEKASSSERKALATLGPRGGKKTAERLKTDPNGDYAQAQRQKLAAANKRRTMSATADKLTIAGWFLKGNAETGQWPTIADAMEEFGVSQPTVRRALKSANVQLPRGRRSPSEK